MCFNEIIKHIQVELVGVKVHQREDLSSAPVCHRMILSYKKVLQHSDDLSDDSHSDDQFIA